MCSEHVSVVSSTHRPKQSARNTSNPFMLKHFRIKYSLSVALHIWWLIGQVNDSVKAAMGGVGVDVGKNILVSLAILSTNQLTLKVKPLIFKAVFGTLLNFLAVGIK